MTTTNPILRINTTMHTAPITRIDVDAAERFLVTGSHDKTARVWDLANGKLLRVLRPPIGPGSEGKVYAVAISPDGETVAVGGWAGHVYLFERGTGHLRHRVGGLPSIAFHFVFDPTGERLAIMPLGTNGLRVVRTADGEEIARDTEYKGSSCGADFDADGRLVTTSYDGHVRLYAKTLRRVLEVRAPSGERPHGAVFSPDGQRVAIGYRDNTSVDVLAGDDLRLLFSVNTAGTNKNLTWSDDGKVLFAAGRFSKDDTHLIRRWEDAGRGPFRDLGGPKNTVMGLRSLQGGRLAYGAQDPAWAVLDADGKAVLERRPETLDPRDSGDAFQVDDNGRTLQFTYEQDGKRPAVFSLAERRLRPDTPIGVKLRPPRTAAPGVEVTGWEEESKPQLNGKRLNFYDGEASNAIAIDANGENVLLGADWSLRCFQPDATQRWKKPVPGVVCAVNISGDGRLAVAAFADGTIRWFRLDNGEELLALFPHIDGKRWILWTPSGYYDTSEGGEELIGWHVNQGLDKEADFLPVDAFRERFYRPDVIVLVLATLDENAAVAAANAIRASKGPVQPEIVRSIEFPPEYKTAGMSILNYFGQVLDEKYPDLDVSVAIEQRGTTVAMRVRTPEGHEDEIAETLDEYGLVVTGEMAMEEFFDGDDVAVVSLQNKLRIVEAELQNERSISRLKDGRTEELRSMNENLMQLLAVSISRDSVNLIQVDASNAVDTRVHANAEANVSVDVTVQLTHTQGALAELAESLPDGEARRQVEDVRDALDTLGESTDPAQVRKSSAGSKLRRLVDEMSDATTTVGKAVQTVQDGVKIAGDVARLAALLLG